MAGQYFSGAKDLHVMRSGLRGSGESWIFVQGCHEIPIFCFLVISCLEML